MFMSGPSSPTMSRPVDASKYNAEGREAARHLDRVERRACRAELRYDASTFSRDPTDCPQHRVRARRDRTPLYPAATTPSVV